MSFLISEVNTLDDIRDKWVRHEGDMRMCVGSRAIECIYNYINGING